MNQSLNSEATQRTLNPQAQPIDFDQRVLDFRQAARECSPRDALENGEKNQLPNLKRSRDY